MPTGHSYSATVSSAEQISEHNISSHMIYGAFFINYFSSFIWIPHKNNTMKRAENILLPTVSITEISNCLGCLIIKCSYKHSYNILKEAF